MRAPPAPSTARPVQWGALVGFRDACVTTSLQCARVGVWWSHRRAPRSRARRYTLHAKSPRRARHRHRRSRARGGRTNINGFTAIAGEEAAISDAYDVATARAALSGVTSGTVDRTGIPSDFAAARAVARPAPSTARPNMHARRQRTFEGAFSACKPALVLGNRKWWACGGPPCKPFTNQRAPYMHQGRSRDTVGAIGCAFSGSLLVVHAGSGRSIRSDARFSRVATTNVRGAAPSSRYPTCDGLAGGRPIWEEKKVRSFYRRIFR